LREGAATPFLRERGLVIWLRNARSLRNRHARRQEHSASGECRNAMRVSEAMTRDVCVCGPGESIRDCAAAMARNDFGAIPVAENNLLIGMVTDRDITVRAVAANKGPHTPVSDVLSRQVLYCFEDQDLEHVARSMGMAKVRRVPVVTRDDRLVGMLSLSDVALRSVKAAGAAMAGLSKRGGPHSQSEKA
jgi:CBS domain-containing protein